jgi:hypothetical protein
MTAIAVAGRTRESYAPPVPFPHSVRVLPASHAADTHRPVEVGGLTKMSRPPNGGGGPDYMKEGSPPWGGLGGYPFTPWERALSVRGGTTPSCMQGVYRSRRVIP